MVLLDFETITPKELADQLLAEQVIIEYTDSASCLIRIRSRIRGKDLYRGNLPNPAFGKDKREKMSPEPDHGVATGSPRTALVAA